MYAGLLGTRDGFGHVEVTGVTSDPYIGTAPMLSLLHAKQTDPPTEFSDAVRQLTEDLRGAKTLGDLVRCMKVPVPIDHPQYAIHWELLKGHVELGLPMHCVLLWLDQNPLPQRLNQEALEVLHRDCAPGRLLNKLALEMMASSDIRCNSIHFESAACGWQRKHLLDLAAGSGVSVHHCRITMDDIKYTCG